ncbi:MAG TPA: hypothetical protein DDW14_03670 [Spirochaetaceae bacterium]|nr:hypothetical protein [Spirochaetaceae bacterium]
MPAIRIVRWRRAGSLSASSIVSVKSPGTINSSSVGIVAFAFSCNQRSSVSAAAGPKNAVMMRNMV